MSLIKHTFKRVEHMIAAPRDPHEEEQARLQENLFYTNLSSLQPKTNAKFWLNRYEVNDRLNGMLRRFFNAVHLALRIKMTTLRSKCSSRWSKKLSGYVVEPVTAMPTVLAFLSCFHTVFWRFKPPPCWYRPLCCLLMVSAIPTSTQPWRLVCSLFETSQSWSPLRPSKRF